MYILSHLRSCISFSHTRIEERPDQLDFFLGTPAGTKDASTPMHCNKERAGCCTQCTAGQLSNLSLGRSHTHSFHATQITHNKFLSPPKIYFLIQTPSAIFTMGKNGGWSQEAPREGTISARPPQTPFLGFSTSERAFTLGRCLRRQGVPTWVTRVIYAAAAVAGDDSPGRQSTELMSNISISQAYTCGVPNMVKNVRQIENGKDNHH